MHLGGRSLCLGLAEEAQRQGWRGCRREWSSYLRVVSSLRVAVEEVLGEEEEGSVVACLPLRIGMLYYPWLVVVVV